MYPFRTFVFCLLIFSFQGFVNGLLAQETFSPPVEPFRIEAKKTSERIQIDGKLDEESWKKVRPITELVQYEPRQGDSVSLQTEIRILFDEENLYISCICFDSLGKKGIRVPNMARDFDYFQNDLLGIAIDGTLDKRNAVAFQTNPYGAQRELLVSDGNNFNREWIALWSVKTSLHEWGWIAEFAIPWKSIRFNPGAKEIGFILVRSMRRLNEYATFPAIPRAFFPYQMAYEAVLTGLELPQSVGANIQVNPYVLGAASNLSRDGQETTENDLKAGGEVKWAVGTNSVLDLTFNTDFAQADVDRQVVNLGRFSILFPERRQFFLEGNEIYTMQAWDGLQPFFSRRIGLDEQGNPIPIDLGARFTNRSTKGNLGGLAVRQRAQGETPQANIGVLRYSRNFPSSSSRIGGMGTFRYDERDASGESNLNTTVTVDGLYRPNQKFNAFWMLSGSQNSGKLNNRGWSGAVWAYYETNDIYVGHVQTVISDKYDPRSGFVDATNYVLTSPALFLRLRPKWLPDKWIRQFSPGVSSYLYHYYDNLEFREGYVSYRPISVDFQNGGKFYYDFNTNWQNLIDAFSPLGVRIAPGTYSYSSHTVAFSSDNSRKVFYALQYSTGGYFNGKINSLTASLRVVPDPHVSLTLNYSHNRIRNLGENTVDLNTDLASAEVRLALNPRVQWITFYQYNTVINRNTLNTRFQWEYRPLSFLFVVVNDNREDFTRPVTGDLGRQTSQQAIVKLAYLKQF